MGSSRAFSLVVFALLSALGVAPAQGAVVVFQTPLNSTQAGKPVSARATFTTGPGAITVVLENLQVDPASAAQCLSGLRFHLSGNESTGTLTSSAGLDRWVAANGSYSDGSLVSTGWALKTVSADLMLDLLGTSTSPEHEIIGPPNATNKYTGNNSITNGPHNPHIGLSATFNLSVPGVTAATTVTSATFQFNTAGGNTTFGTPVPEPASLIGASLAMLALRRRRA